MKKVFFDMDGVLAEYRKDSTVEEMSVKGYFASLRPEWNMIKALIRLALDSDKLGFSVCVLTKVYPTQFKYSVSEKAEWRDEFLPELLDSEFIMVNGEKEEKSEAIKNRLGCEIDSDCFLIDDYNYNLSDWMKNGGSAIKYVNGINDKNRSFIGKRISYKMSAEEIYDYIINLIGGNNTPTTAAA